MGKQATLHPIRVLKDAIMAWANNLIPAVVCYGFCIVLSKSLKWLQPLVEDPQTGWKAWAMPVFFFMDVLAILIINSLLVLVILRYFQRPKEQALRWVDALRDAIPRINPYLKASVLLLIFILAITVPAVLLAVAGQSFYKGAMVLPQAVKMAGLLISSTVLVVLGLVAVWYGFFFSLAPLVAAYENKGPWAAMQESRKLVRGNALRYLAIFLLVAIVYVAVGILAVLIITHFTYSRRVLNLVDPVIALLIGPLAIAAWYSVYKRLRNV